MVFESVKRGIILGEPDLIRSKFLKEDMGPSWRDILRLGLKGLAVMLRKGL